MKKRVRRERTIEELLRDTDRIEKARITPILQGLYRMQGPIDEIEDLPDSSESGPFDDIEDLIESSVQVPAEEMKISPAEKPKGIEEILEKYDLDSDEETAKKTIKETVKDSVKVGGDELVSENEISEEIEEDVKVCDICGDIGREEQLAVCTKCNDGAEHIYCMREVLDEVPQGEWLCEDCEMEQDSKRQRLPKNTTKLELSNEKFEDLTIASLSKGLHSEKMKNANCKEPNGVQQCCEVAPHGDGDANGIGYLATQDVAEPTGNSKEAAYRRKGTGTSQESPVKFDSGKSKPIAAELQPLSMTNPAKLQTPQGKVKPKIEVIQFSPNVPRKARSHGSFGRSSLKGQNDADSAAAALPSEQKVDVPPQNGGAMNSSKLENSLATVDISMSSEMDTSVAQPTVKPYNASNANIATISQGLETPGSGPRVLKRPPRRKPPGISPPIVADKPPVNSDSLLKNNATTSTNKGNFINQAREQLPPTKQNNMGQLFSNNSKERAQGAVHKISHDMKVELPVMPLQAFPLPGKSKVLAIPELQYIWQGSFEVTYRNGESRELCRVIQAHLSSISSLKVTETIPQLPSNVQLEKVQRVSSWPLQFLERGPKEEDVGLFFFASDMESYQICYSNLVEDMLNKDLALRGNVGEKTLLVFASNLLPENCQRWNHLYFLWGLFTPKLEENMPVSDMNEESLMPSQTVSDFAGVLLAESSRNRMQNCQALNHVTTDGDCGGLQNMIVTSNHAGETALSNDAGGLSDGTPEPMDIDESCGGESIRGN